MVDCVGFSFFAFSILLVLQPYDLQDHHTIDYAVFSFFAFFCVFPILLVLQPYDLQDRLAMNFF
jgi:hypothetical protein